MLTACRATRETQLESDTADVGEAVVKTLRKQEGQASHVPSPRRTVDDTDASPGLAGRSSEVMPRSSFMAAS